MIQELKKLLPKKKCFKKRMQMLHFVASTDYEKGVLYSADGGQTYFIDDKLYRHNVCIAKIDRENERVLVNASFRQATSLWRYQDDLKDAFKHYKFVRLTAFNIIETTAIFNKIVLAMKNDPTPPDYEEFIEAYDSVLYTGGELPEFAELYHEAKKVVEAEEKRREKERKKREREQKRAQELCYKMVKPYLPILLKGKDWNSKLKCFCDNRRSVDIPVEEWQRLHEFEKAQPFWHYWSISHCDWCFRDGKGWSRDEDTPPPNPRIEISGSVLNRYKGVPDYADFLYLDNDHIKTTRGIDIDDSSKLVRNLLKRFINSSDEARHKFIGLHVGSFVIREWNPEQRYLQIGCHRFYEQTLIEFADYCEKGK